MDDVKDVGNLFEFLLSVGKASGVSERILHNGEVATQEEFLGKRHQGFIYVASVFLRSCGYPALAASRARDAIT